MIEDGETEIFRMCYSTIVLYKGVQKKKLKVMIQEYWVKSPVSDTLLLLWRKVNLRWAFVLFLMGHYLNLLLQLSVNINTKHSNHWCKCCYETMKNTFCNSNMTLKIDHPNTLDNILEETDIVHIGSASLTRFVKQTNKKKGWWSC